MTIIITIIGTEIVWHATDVVGSASFEQKSLFGVIRYERFEAQSSVSGSL